MFTQEEVLALFKAAKQKETEKIQALITAGSDLHARIRTGQTS